MKEENVTCGRCNGSGKIKVHLPSKEKAMFGLLDFGISAAWETIKGRNVDCPNCNGYGYIILRETYDRY